MDLITHMLIKYKGEFNAIQKINRALKDYGYISDLFPWSLTVQGAKFWMGVEHYGHSKLSRLALNEYKKQILRARIISDKLALDFKDELTNKKKINIRKKWIIDAIKSPPLLDDIFIWAHTNEGHNFWSDIVDNGHNENSLKSLQAILLYINCLERGLHEQ